MEADVAVIGGGSAGFGAAWSAAQLGCDLMSGRDRKADFNEPGAPPEPILKMNGAIAASSCRLSRTMMQLGEAAGTAAHLACERNVALRQVSGDEIRHTMAEKIDRAEVCSTGLDISAYDSTTAIKKQDVGKPRIQFCSQRHRGNRVIDH